MQTEPTGDAMDLALWRYGIISALLHRDANDIGLYHLLEQLAARQYLRPDGSIVQLSAETLRKWLYRYQSGGLAALATKQRSDKGRHQLSPALADALFDQRKRHPRWSLALILKQLAQAGLWNGRRPARSTIYRFAKKHNLMRDPHLQPATYRPFAFEHFGQLWMADFLHGPRLWINRRKTKTYLHAIIDDATRYVVAGAFYTAESAQNMLTDLMCAVRRFGLCLRFYTDNGACYASRHLKIVCARMKVQLVHSPPYRPQGRAKIERFFGTLRQQFLAADSSKTLEQINTALSEYLARYNESWHTSLKCSPLEKRLKVKNRCRALPVVADLEALFRMQRRCRVYKDGTVRLLRRHFEVPKALPGSRVTVYYTPWDLTRLYYGDDMIPARPVELAANARRFEHPIVREMPHENR
jgi:transposase InsO family protein